MARNYVISHYIYFLQENKRLQQMRREKSVVLPIKKAYWINVRYNEIGEVVRLDKVFFLGSCPLLSYSMDFPRVGPGSTAWLHFIGR